MSISARSLRHLGPLGAFALVLVVAGLLVAAFAERLAPFDPLLHDLENRLQPPSSTHPMGTDNFGRDVLSRVIYGTRAALFVGLFSVGMATALGAALGILSAMVGGALDLLGQRLADALLAFPALVLALVLVAAFGPSSWVVASALTLAFTPQLARLARARCLELNAREYVLAARAVGASSWRIALRHILPGSLSPVLVLATGYVGKAMVLEAVLSYLGLGVPPPEPSWGRMIFEGASLYLETAPWLTVFPGLALSALVLGFALLGDALRDALDPHQRHVGVPSAGSSRS
jgi:peptide/nickel transport system permease protein